MYQIYPKDSQTVHSSKVFQKMKLYINFLQGTHILFLKILLYLFKKSHSSTLDLRFFVFI